MKKSHQQNKAHKERKYKARAEHNKNFRKSYRKKKVKSFRSVERFIERKEFRDRLLNIEYL